MSLIDLIQSFDLAVLDRVHSAFSNSFTDGFWHIITIFGDGGIFWIVLACVLLLFRRTRKGGLAMVLALTFGVILGNMILKNAVARIRPYDVNVFIELVTKRHTDFSFPSGHTTAALGAALALFYVNKKYGLPAVILALLIVYSRLHLYVHYTSDLLGGIVVALITSLLGFVLAELIMRRFEPWLDGKLAARKAAKAQRTGGDNASGGVDNVPGSGDNTFVSIDDAPERGEP